MKVNKFATLEYRCHYSYQYYNIYIYIYYSIPEKNRQCYLPNFQLVSTELSSERDEALLVCGHFGMVLLLTLTSVEQGERVYMMQFQIS